MLTTKAHTWIFVGVLAAFVVVLIGLRSWIAQSTIETVQKEKLPEEDTFLLKVGEEANEQVSEETTPQHQSDQEFIQYTVGIVDVIPVSVIPQDGGYKYEIGVDDPTINDLKISLDLTEDQIRLIANYAKFRVQFVEIGKAIDHWEMLESIRKLSQQEKELKKRDQEKLISMQDTLFKKTAELRKSLGDKEAQFLDWISEKKQGESK